MPLKGKFDFHNCNWKRDGTIFYILGEGETVEGMYDQLITSPALQRNVAIKRTYEQLNRNVRDGRVCINTDWLASNKDVPADVRREIEDAIKEKEEKEMRGGRH